jgi:sec-independent protein translocase protein TatB
MFNLGFGEMLVIAFVFIIVVGPDRLPELLRTLGKALRSIQKANQELQSSIGIDKLRQEMMYPKDLQDALKWRPKPTYHTPLEPPKTATDPAPPATPAAPPSLASADHSNPEPEPPKNNEEKADATSLPAAEKPASEVDGKNGGGSG